MDAKELETALERFVLDDRDLQRLEDGLSEINLFEAIGAVRSEHRHSDFLAFLLDPGANHGLEEVFLKRFLQRAVLDAAAQDRSQPVRAIDLALCDLDDTRVERELDGIDLLVTSDGNRLVTVIENKVASGEHSDQLAVYHKRISERFPKHRRIFLYLTMDGAEPSHEAYAGVSYGCIVEILEDLLSNRSGGFRPDVAVLVRHYVRMLRRHFMDNSEVADLARRIYQRHRQALDYIFEQRPDRTLYVAERLKTLIETCPQVVLDQSAKTYTQFYRREWAGDLLRGEGWTPSKRMLMFEFRNFPDMVNLVLLIGPGDPTVRERLFKFVSDYGAPFRPSSRNLFAKWQQIWSKPFVTRKESEALDFESISAKLEQTWKQFVEADLPAISQAIAKW